MGFDMTPFKYTVNRLIEKSSVMLVTSTFAKVEWPEPELDLLVAALHPHGAHRGVEHQV